MRRKFLIVASVLAALASPASTLGSPANAQQTYHMEYVMTPSRLLLHVLANNDEKNQQNCESLNGEITPEIVRRTGADLVGWSFVRSDRTFGYVTWIIEKSGLHTTFVANYFLGNCALTETRAKQKTFDGANRYAEAQAEYNRLILETLGR
jgi:hypothetical protein